MQNTAFKTEKTKGMTLVEVVLYLALFAIIFMTMMELILAIGEKNRESSYRNTIVQDAIFVLEHMEDAFVDANGIDEVSSVFTSDAGVVVLETDAGNVTYSVNSGRMQVDDGVEANYISSSTTSFDRFYLERINDRSGEAAGVRVTIELSADDSNFTDSITTAIRL